MFKILLKTYIRIGNVCYKDTYGLTTLENRHITLKGSEIIFDFIGKRSIKNKVIIFDSEIARDLLLLKNNCKGPSDKIFKTIEGLSVTSIMMNDFLAGIVGPEFSCKDFRTYAANILFIKKLGTFKNGSNYGSNIRETFKEVSEKLGHSAAISKGSYVVPYIIDKYKENPNYFNSSKDPTTILISLL